MVNYKGEICIPDIIVSDPDYGAGVGAAESNGGLLICGGENNIWKGPDNPMDGGQVPALLLEPPIMIVV